LPLVDLWKSRPDTVFQFTIEQVLATSGDGNLKDGSLCADELREYLRSAPSDKLREYVDGCLTRSFNKSGFVLQDLINELGRRLDYRVQNGSYQGRPNLTGFDGIWDAPDGHALIVEVKTTDAYRINLDTVAGYRDALIFSNRITKDSSILIVVGRSDTGDIEAQVRGSKHAWDVRLISADALTKLVQLKERADEEETVAKIRGILKPFEYTRLDNIIDVIFTAAKDAEAATQLERSEDASLRTQDSARASVVQEHTDRDLIDDIRTRVIVALGRREGTDFIARSRALYWSVDEKVRVSCSLSKRHQRGTYWYAYHPHWDEFLAAGERGFSVWGCVDRNVAYVLPRSFMTDVLQDLYVTIREDTGKSYWHVELEPGDGDGMYFLIRKLGRRVPIGEYEIRF
jgi:hypothetical protein